MESKYGSTPVAPRTTLKKIASHITLLEPLSRRGQGPGLVVLVQESGLIDDASTTRIERGIPSPSMKWAEESYTVVEITQLALEHEPSALKLALAGLEGCHTTVPKHSVGIICYSPELWNRVASDLASYPQIAGAAIFADAAGRGSEPLKAATVSQMHHLAGTAVTPLARSKKWLTAYEYPTAGSFLFATPFQPEFAYNSESLSHTRNLTFFKNLMGGPYFDLEAIWDEHTYYEFDNRSVECTMATMVQEPYVNHIPTLTGGIGREQLTAFYRDHFIFQNPADTETEIISRSVGIDRVIDEFIFKCTHNSRIDWLLPGIPPTGRKLEIPFTAVVNIRGDRLYHEHISWDQATVLTQLGLLPPSLPFSIPIRSEQPPASGMRFLFQVPAAGVQAAQKLRNKDFCESNKMIEFSLLEVQES
ncbi:hypothetical protein INS49_008119 [Diaporthe citri]|uniref:uncharacterized protein n=1 Tax=Diaporthe citri TaxID=83186 RepID=UPI001C7FBBE9|nr:uncharacterized protein INS49_008119 [Diaporthe citri]KAG6363024.1 hypothetical protein INS49_008119 [Diaporthe citri]